MIVQNIDAVVWTAQVQPAGFISFAKNDVVAKQYILTAFSETIILHTQEGVDLTEPDRADSIEQMLARRAAGLPETFTALNVRPFPTDPNSVKTASKLLKEFEQSAKQELDQLQQTQKQTIADAKQKAAQLAKEKAEFEQYKAQQNQPK